VRQPLKTIATTSAEGVVVIWSSETGEPISSISEGGNTAEFSPDGRYLLTNGIIREIESGKPIASVQGEPDNGKTYSQTQMFYSSNGEYIAVTNTKFAKEATSYSTVWHLVKMNEQVDLVKEVVPRCLTPRQRERAFLNPTPPEWCRRMKKWPFETPD
jgi:WD40 repeat protein